MFCFFQVRRFSVVYLFKPEDSRHSNLMKLKTFSSVVASLQTPITLAIAWMNKIVLQNSKCTSENICNSEKSFAIFNRTNKIFFLKLKLFPIIFPESEEKISAINRGDTLLQTN